MVDVNIHYINLSLEVVSLFTAVIKTYIKLFCIMHFTQCMLMQYIPKVRIMPTNWVFAQQVLAQQVTSVFHPLLHATIRVQMR